MVLRERSSDLPVSEAIDRERLVALGGALARMQVHETAFTAVERKIADAFRSDGRALIGLSGDDVAERLGISKPSVIRFCRRLGYSGLREFKLALAAEVRDDRLTDSAPIAAEDSYAAIVDKVTAAAQRALADSRDVLDPHAVERVTTALRGAGRVQLFGVGGSASIAQDAHYRFMRLGLPVAVVTDTHLQPIAAANLSASDVAFVISHTGRSREPVDVLEQAQKAGATTILLTSFANTPAARWADIVLLTAPVATAPWEGMAPLRVAQLTVIDMICVAVAGRDPKRQALRSRHDALLDRYALSGTGGGTSIALPGDTSRPTARNMVATMASIDHDRRRLAIEGVTNARHLGGFSLPDGGVTAPSVIRSGLLWQITGAGVRELQELGVTAVVDLRNDRDCLDYPAPDLEHSGIRIIQAPMHDQRDIPYPDIDDHEGWIFAYWVWVYWSQPAMRTLVEAIAGAEGSVLMHCHLGIDRTGITSALLLDVLGVDEREIVGDFLASPDSAGLEYLIPATLEKVRERWGSSEGYFLATGVSPETIAKARARMTAR